MSNFNVIINNKQASWSEDIVKNKLQKIGKLNGKKVAWVRSDLGTSKSNWLTRLIWSVVAKHFSWMRKHFYGVDLHQSRSLLEQIGKQLPDNLKIKELFHQAVGTFNQIAPRHKVGAEGESILLHSKGLLVNLFDESQVTSENFDMGLSTSNTNNNLSLQEPKFSPLNVREITNETAKICRSAGCQKVAKNWCRCMGVAYCNKKCKSADWKFHRGTCKTAKPFTPIQEFNTLVKREHLNPGLKILGLDLFLTYANSIINESHFTVVEVGSENNIIADSLRKYISKNTLTVGPTPNKFLPINTNEPITVDYPTVPDLLSEKPALKGECILVLNWACPNDSTYDIDAINDLKPTDILIVYESTGSAGGKEFLEWIKSPDDRDYTIIEKTEKKVNALSFFGNDTFIYTCAWLRRNDQPNLQKEYRLPKWLK